MGAGAATPLPVVTRASRSGAGPPTGTTDRRTCSPGPTADRRYPVTAASCSSVSSRNFSLGKGIGEGGRPADLLADRRTVAEGAFTAPVLKRAADALGVDMPIVGAVCALLRGEADVDQVVERLLARPLRPEGV